MKAGISARGTARNGPPSRSALQVVAANGEASHSQPGCGPSLTTAAQWPRSRFTRRSRSAQRPFEHAVYRGEFPTLPRMGDCTSGRKRSHDRRCWQRASLGLFTSSNRALMLHAHQPGVGHQPACQSRECSGHAFGSNQRRSAMGFRRWVYGFLVRSSATTMAKCHGV